MNEKTDKTVFQLVCGLCLSLSGQYWAKITDIMSAECFFIAD
jgi:hypothetical protein